MNYTLLKEWYSEELYVPALLRVLACLSNVRAGLVMSYSLDQVSGSGSVKSSNFDKVLSDIFTLSYLLRITIYLQDFSHSNTPFVDTKTRLIWLLVIIFDHISIDGQDNSWKFIASPEKPWQLASITRGLIGGLIEQCNLKLWQLWLCYRNMNIKGTRKVEIDYLWLPEFCLNFRCDLRYHNFNSNP